MCFTLITILEPMFEVILKCAEFKFVIILLGPFDRMPRLDRDLDGLSVASFSVLQLGGSQERLIRHAVPAGISPWINMPVAFQRSLRIE